MKILVSKMRSTLEEKLENAKEGKPKQKAQAALDAFEKTVSDEELEDDDEYDDGIEEPKVETPSASVKSTTTKQMNKSELPTAAELVDINELPANVEKKTFKCYIRRRGSDGELVAIMANGCEGGVTLNQFASKLGVPVSELAEGDMVTFKATRLKAGSYYVNGGDEASRLKLKLKECTVVTADHWRVLAADKDGISAEKVEQYTELRQEAKLLGTDAIALMDFRSKDAARMKAAEAAVKAASRVATDE